MLGLQNVRLQPVMVRHWVRGPVEEVIAITGGHEVFLSACALGDTVGTPEEGITANVVEVHSLAEVTDQLKGKIVFYNRPMNPAESFPFAAYAAAGDQRNEGAKPAGKAGAVGMLVRSLTWDDDDVPHTGYTGYDEKGPKIPAAALSTMAANKLSALLKKDPALKVRLRLSAEMLPDAPSSNVIGEIPGTEKPQEIVLLGAHLDSWDKGTGAHDDAAGCSHVLEAARLLLSMDLKPKRTIRFVLFMNEENGSAGADGYAEAVKPDEHHILGIDSDAGGFEPSGWFVDSTPENVERVKLWAKYLEPIRVERVTKAPAGSDLEALMKKGTVSVELMSHNMRYFDYHHSDNDTLDKVHPRELELGAIAIATMTYMAAQEGL